MERLLQITADLLEQSECAHLSRSGHSRFTRVPIIGVRVPNVFFALLGEGRDIVPSNRMSGISLKRPVKKVLHSHPEILIFEDPVFASFSHFSNILNCL